MEFGHRSEELLIQGTARRFAEEVLAPRAAARDGAGLFPEEELRTLAELGLLGLTVPEAYGGVEAGPVAMALALAEIAWGDPSVAVAVSVSNMVAETLWRFGSEEQRRRHLPGLCNGERLVGAFALSEPQAGSDPSAMKTRAQKVEGGYRLSGNKLWTTSGDRAGLMIVMAVTGQQGGRPSFSAFLVEQGTPGVTVGRHEKKMGLRGSSTVGLTFEEVFVPDEGRLGGEGEGLRIAFTALDGGRIGIASQAVGVARAALQAATAYARDRQQFGRPLAQFQAIQMHLADAAVAVEAAWLLTLQAAWRKARGLPFSRQAAQAKLFATERAFQVVDSSLQVLGGYGYTREFPVERLWRDVRVTSIYEGTSQIQKLVIARQLLREAAGAG